MEDLDNVFEEDLGLDTHEEVEETSIFDEPKAPESIFEEVKQTNPLIDDLLKSKGITDSKVIIVDENNVEQEVDFYSLSKEDQLEILNYNEVSTSKDEEFLNSLKENNLTVEEYLKQYRDSIVAELGVPTEPSYDIDAYDDQELYLLDLKTKYDLSDEELLKDLEKELLNPELFNKKVAKLRSEYKQLEDNYKEEQQKEFNAQRETQYNEFVDTMVDVAVKTTDLFGIELEDEEKNNVLSSLLELDEQGTSNFYKALNDPENLYKAAWFLTYGKQAFDAIKGVYETEISKLKKEDKKIVIKEKPKSNSIDYGLF